MTTLADFRLKTLSLNHGAGRMPAIGFGTLIADSATTSGATRIALKAGYRHFDCAERYRNEREVGEALHEGLSAEGIARDVRTAWANTTTAYQRLDVTAQLLVQASLAQDLATQRFTLGLSNIVELTQAQLNVTEAQIASLSAKYDYQSQYATLQYTLGALR